MRTLPILLLALVLVPLLADRARAAEVFVLDNGVVLHGRVVRETDDKIVVRLAGFAEENTVTVRRREIVRRFVSMESRPPRRVEVVAPDGATDGPGTVLSVPPSREGPVDTEAPDRPPPPARSAFVDIEADEEPALESESFLARIRRVSGVALPHSAEGLLVVALLCFVVLTIMVAGGTRALGMKAPSLGGSSSLGFLLGAFLVADYFLHQDLLRADRAIWVLPAQGAVWLLAARTVLDAPLSRTVPLFAFVLFGSTCFFFFTGSVLVSL